MLLLLGLGAVMVREKDNDFYKDGKNGIQR